ncbi:MAG: DUF2249 domain-containing protein [Treponema sp.]
MAYSDWKDKTGTFKKIDVRNVQGNFFPALKKQAEEVLVGNGLEIIQSFEPIPLYAVMDNLGYERHTEQTDAHEFHAYFYRIEVKTDDGSIPMRPAALTNFPLIDKELGSLAVRFWDVTWNDAHRHLPYETRLLLSLTNAVGAGRMRQATRELVKVYAAGIDSAALDDVFELLAWNQGIGFFSSEIGPSTLFKAYKVIKQQEEKGVPREKIIEHLRENFGEKNPDVQVL